MGLKNDYLSTLKEADTLVCRSCSQRLAELIVMLAKNNVQLAALMREKKVYWFEELTRAQFSWGRIKGRKAGLELEFVDKHAARAFFLKLVPNSNLFDARFAYAYIFKCLCKRRAQIIVYIITMMVTLLGVLF